MKAVIVLSQSTINKDVLIDKLKGDCLLIGVDGGCNLLYEYDLIPDLLIGDFDSIKDHVLESYIALKVDVVRHDVDKDRTDGELAIIEALNKNCKEIYITGTDYTNETDHFLGNIFLLNKYPICKIFNNTEEIMVALPSSYKINKNKGAFISFLPLEKTNVVLGGFQYNGCFSIDLGDTTTMRNLVVDEIADIQVKTGKILIIQRK